MQAPHFPMAALRCLFVVFGRALASLGRALHALVMVLGMQPSLTRDPAIGAYQALSRRRRARRPRPGGPRRVIPLRASVDDPHVQLRITM